MSRIEKPWVKWVYFIFLGTYAFCFCLVFSEFFELLRFHFLLMGNPVNCEEPVGLAKEADRACEAQSDPAAQLPSPLFLLPPPPASKVHTQEAKSE